ncbi:MAG TPA: glycosyltransferase [Actinocrinis sp.]|jgi:glycosyltransferase involved in cell wall biosynthesis|uniref:glycosyltransferase n=1 Tax=Actinocrinis sp. TaxID=1920516 RepID=UPI002DDD69A5|nr:glycosyltransferase [Actinocrinis sp.]HEV3170567.1 glycosyltransferase [Actinocrinis sp.]
MIATEGGRSGPAPTAVIVVLDLPVPDDHRVWAQAEVLRDDGVAVTVVCPACPDRPGGRTTIDGINVVYIHANNPARASAKAAKRALRLTNSPRMVQACNPPDLLAGLLRWARRQGCTSVYDQHEVTPALARARFGRWLSGYRELRTIRAADVVITPSQEQVDRLRARYGREAILVRTAEVDDSANPAERNGSAAGKTILGYLGRIGEHDGLDELIDAVCELRCRGARGFRLEIAGDGPALAAVRRQADRLNVSDLVAFHGWLDPPGVSSFLERIDAMVVPDPDLEYNHYCAMNKVTYAMARGLPVVLRPLRENARLVGDSPFLAADLSPGAFADALDALLLASPGERSAAGECGRKRYEREFAWDINGPRYLVSVSPGLRA